MAGASPASHAIALPRNSDSVISLKFISKNFTYFIIRFVSTSNATSLRLSDDIFAAI